MIVLALVWWFAAASSNRDDARVFGPFQTLAMCQQMGLLTTDDEQFWPRERKAQSDARRRDINKESEATEARARKQPGVRIQGKYGSYILKDGAMEFSGWDYQSRGRGPMTALSGCVSEESAK